MSKRKSSQKRIDASRINGAKSHGPITPEGKKKSSQNAIQHGFCADIVVLECESREAFLESLDDFVERFGPAGEFEHALVEEIAAAFWRQRRAWSLETKLFNKELALNPEGGIVAALEVLAAKPALASILFT